MNPRVREALDRVRDLLARGLPPDIATAKGDALTHAFLTEHALQVLPEISGVVRARFTQPARVTDLWYEFPVEDGRRRRALDDAYRIAHDAMLAALAILLESPDVDKRVEWVERVDLASRPVQNRATRTTRSLLQAIRRGASSWLVAGNAEPRLRSGPRDPALRGEFTEVAAALRAQLAKTAVRDALDHLAIAEPATKFAAKSISTAIGLYVDVARGEAPFAHLEDMIQKVLLTTGDEKRLSRAALKQRLKREGFTRASIVAHMKLIETARASRHP